MITTRRFPDIPNTVIVGGRIWLPSDNRRVGIINTGTVNPMSLYHGPIASNRPFFPQSNSVDPIVLTRHEYGDAITREIWWTPDAGLAAPTYAPLELIEEDPSVLAKMYGCGTGRYNQFNLTIPAFPAIVSLLPANNERVSVIVASRFLVDLVLSSDNSPAFQSAFCASFGEIPARFSLWNCGDSIRNEIFIRSIISPSRDVLVTEVYCTRDNESQASMANRRLFSLPHVVNVPVSPARVMMCGSNNNRVRVVISQPNVGGSLVFFSGDGSSLANSLFSISNASPVVLDAESYGQLVTGEIWCGSTSAGVTVIINEVLRVADCGSRPFFCPPKQTSQNQPNMVQ